MLAIEVKVEVAVASLSTSAIEVASANRKQLLLTRSGEHSLLFAVFVVVWMCACYELWHSIHSVPFCSLLCCAVLCCGISFASFCGAESWPSSIRHVYLDGNNMLFVSGAIRSVTLQSMKRGEAALSGVAEAVTHALQRAGKLVMCAAV